MTKQDKIQRETGYYFEKILRSRSVVGTSIVQYTGSFEDKGDGTV